MRIAKYNNIDLHWWGSDLLLIRNIGEYYIFEEEEAFFVEHLCKTNEVADLVYNITHELDVDSVTVENFINIFMENFADYFYFTHGECLECELKNFCEFGCLDDNNNHRDECQNYTIAAIQVILENLDLFLDFLAFADDTE